LQDFIVVTLAAGFDELAHDALTELDRLEDNAGLLSPRVEPFLDLDALSRFEILARKSGPLRHAVTRECEKYANNARLPQTDWIRKWLAAGADRTDHTDENETFGDAIDALSKSQAEPDAIYEVVTLLLSHGALTQPRQFRSPGPEFYEHSVLRALRRSIPDEKTWSRWRKVWCVVAQVSFKKRLKDVLDLANDPSIFRQERKREDLEAMAVVALTASVPDHNAELGDSIQDILLATRAVESKKLLARWSFVPKPQQRRHLVTPNSQFAKRT